MRKTTTRFSFQATRRRRSVAESANNLATVVENLKDYAIFTCDPEGHILDWNAGVERIKGYKAEEIIGRHFSIFYTPEDRRAGKPQKELAIAAEEGRSESEGWRVRKNRSRFWVNEVVTPVKNEFGHVIGFTKISRDLTERREAEDALRMMNESLERRVRERTAALEISQRELKCLALQLSRAELRERQRIAAELHSTLAQLLALAEIRVASIDYAGTFSERASKGLDELRNYIQHAIHSTRSLMSRLSPPVLKKKNLALAVQTVVEEMESHGLKARFHDDGKPKPLDTEGLALLYQAVRELLFNVLKHARTQTASVVLRRVEGMIEIHVQDAGVGFNRTARWRRKAFGFGLLHLRERLSLLGGSLDILPNGPKGTHVLVTAPIKASARPRMSFRPRLKPDRIKNGHIRILIVDDNKLMREGLRKILSEQADLRIVGEAANAQTALALTRKARPHVVLMDVNMPGMDGIEATRRISRRSSAPRVIGFSIHDDKEVESAMRKAGATAYVTKQESPEKLYSVIRDCVQKRKTN